MTQLSLHRTDTTFLSSPQSAANNSLSTHTRESKGFTLGDGPAVREDGERGELGGCEDPLNLVWKGVGSLSEQLAEVDTFFEKLEQDMDHDREVIGYTYLGAMV